jgi:amino-acid N-acetyltransferase
MKPVFSRASSDDIEAIHRMIGHFASQGLILIRSRDEITSNLEAFFVCRLGKKIAGIVSYHDYGHSLKEIRSLAVSEEYQKNHIGSFILKNILSLLCEKHEPKIFTLTYSPLFFIKNGFHEVNKDTLPEKIWKDCSKCDSRETCGETALVYGG